MNRNRKAILAGILSATLMGGYLIAQQGTAAGVAKDGNSDPLTQPPTPPAYVQGQSTRASDFAPVATPPATFSPQGGIGGGWIGGGGFGSTGMASRSSPLYQATDKLNQAKAAVKKANTDEEKKKADEQLVKALNDYFEQDMVQRKTELAAVKKRLEDLEKQLQKRESSKGDIVDLQKKVIINELNGLGFYGSNSPGSSGVFADRVVLDPNSSGIGFPGFPTTPVAPAAPPPVRIPFGRTVTVDPASPIRTPSSESPKTTPVSPAPATIPPAGQKP